MHRLSLILMLTAVACGGPGVDIGGVTPDPVRTVTISPSSVSPLAVGNQATLTARVTGGDGSVRVAWTSNNPTVASVAGSNASAVVTALVPGTAVIIATANEVSASVTITVLAPSNAEAPAFTWQSASVRSVGGVAFGGGQWVALEPFGVVHVSTDAIRWRTINTGLNMTPRALVWSGTQFVAVGDGGAITSTDGATWTPHVISGVTIGKRLTSLVWTGSRFFASEDGGRVFSSADGATWTTVEINQSSGVSNLVWGNNRLIANLGSDRVIVSTDDGRTWTPSPFLPNTLLSGGMTWDGRRFVRMCGTTMATSTDGLTWTATATTLDAHVDGALPFQTLRNVHWTGTRYVASNLRTVPGTPFAGGVLAVSDDAIHWSEVDAGDHGIINGFAESPTSVVAYGEDLFQSANGVAWTLRLPNGQWARSATWSLDRFVAVQSNGLVMTKDGMTWQRFSLTGTTTSDFLADAHATWTGQLYILAGARGTIFTSPDGRTWTARQSGTAADFLDLLWTGTRAVAMARNGTIASSTDGIAWSAQNVASSFADIEWSGSRLVAVTTGSAYASTTGTSWTTSALDAAPIRVIWDGTRFLAMDSFQVYGSSDGTAWTRIGELASSAPRPESITRFRNLLIGCGNRTMYSSTVTAWSVIEPPMRSSCRTSAANASQLFLLNGEQALIGTAP